MSEAPTFARELAEALAREGIDTIFGLMGEGNLKFVGSWVNDVGGTFVAARHEAAAVAMAQGYARTSGRKGVCTLTHGPGMTNALTALVTAQRANADVLAIIGSLHPNQAGMHNQYLDHEALASASGLTWLHLSEPERMLPADILQPGTLVLDIPATALDLPASPVDFASADAAPPAAAHDVAAVEDARRLLAAARRPIILAGYGAHASGARDVLVQLSRLIGAPVATTLQAKGLFSDCAVDDLGVAGGFSTSHLREIFARADCVIAFGASLNQWTTKQGSLLAGKALIQVDSDPSALSRFQDATVAVQGDCADVAGALVDSLGQLGPPRDRESWSSGVTDAVPGPGRQSERVAQWLEGILPPSRVLAVDAGHFMGDPCATISVPDPDAFVWTCDFGSIGLGLAASIGAAEGRVDSTTVAVVGDGGLMMSLGDLDTAARQGRRLVIVVVDDAAYGAEVHHLRASGWPADAALFDPVDFVAVAGGLGMDAVRLDIDNVDQRDGVAAMIRNLRRPLLVHVPISDTEPADWFAALL